MRQPHYWKLAGAKCAPCEIVCVDTETWHGDLAKCEGGELHKLRLGCALAYRLERGRRTRQQRITFTRAAEFWELVWSRLNPRRPVWVFAHNAAYDLGVLGAWDLLLGSTLDVEKACVSGTLLYIVTRRGNSKLVFCDTLNYYRCSLAALGKSVGCQKMEMPAQSEPDSVWANYCMNDVDVTAAGVDALIDFTRREMLGPWQPTIAGLAFSGYRSRFMRNKVLVHTYPNSLEIERGAYYGGVVDTPRVGVRVSGPVYELDVCSMYPSVCRESLPYYRVNDTRRIGVEGVKRLAKQYHVCAEVTVETADDVYPVRCKDGTYYPTGRYQTYLAHPELMAAIDRGHVKWIHRAAWYRHAPIFREYMEHFVSKKSEYRKSGNEAFATLCKYYANSLYGKTGQLSPKWVEWNADAMAELERVHGLPEGSLTDTQSKPPDLYDMESEVRLDGIPDPVPVRDYYGIVEVKVGEYESRDSCPVIAATVTSYARMLLRRIQQIAGADHWYYSDTDSIWCDGEGKARLEAAGLVRPDEIGYLDVKDVHAWIVVHGPKDYETDKVRRLKGVRPSARSDGAGGWVQLHFPNAASQIKRGEREGVFVASVTKHLSRTLTKCVRLPDGRTRPMVFPLEHPETKSGKRRRKVGN